MQLHALTDAVLRWIISHGDSSERQAARALVAHWIDVLPGRFDIRVASGATSAWTWERSVRWLYTISTFARALGLRAQASAMLARTRELTADSPMEDLPALFDVAEFLLALPDITTDR